MKGEAKCPVNLQITIQTFVLHGLLEKVPIRQSLLWTCTIANSGELLAGIPSVPSTSRMKLRGNIEECDTDT